MWKTLAASASSNGLCEGWERFTVPRFAWAGHFHGSFCDYFREADFSVLTLGEYMTICHSFAIDHEFLSTVLQGADYENSSQEKGKC